MADLDVDGRIILKHLRDIRCEYVNWIKMLQNETQWRAIVSTAITIQISYKKGTLLGRFKKDAQVRSRSLYKIDFMSLVWLTVWLTIFYFNTFTHVFRKGYCTRSSFYDRQWAFLAPYVGIRGIYLQCSLIIFSSHSLISLLRTEYIISQARIIDITSN
jgi:hypothetical protein